jgi:hypothetical protein
MLGALSLDSGALHGMVLDLYSAKTSAGPNLHDSWCRLRLFSCDCSKELCSAFLLCAKQISYVVRFNASKHLGRTAAERAWRSDSL